MFQEFFKNALELKKKLLQTKYQELLKKIILFFLKLSKYFKE